MKWAQGRNFLVRISGGEITAPHPLPSNVVSDTISDHRLNVIVSTASFNK